MAQSRRLAAVIGLGLLASTFLVTPASARSHPDVGDFRRAVTVRGIVHHLDALADIANDNGGTRASGTPGYEDSVDYVVHRLRRAGYRPTVQAFEFPFFQQTGPSTFEKTAPDAQIYAEGSDFFLMDFSGTGDVTAGLQPTNDIVIPPGAEPSTSNAGCEPEDFTGFTPGNIALIQRGTCTFEQKADNAIAASAVGVVMFNEGQPGRTDAGEFTLGRPFDIPVVFTSFAIGEALYNQIQGGASVSVHLTTQTLSEQRTTWNVIADTRRGRADRTIVVGAHLDSVLAGPGINDNGSGSATILELAEELSDLHVRPTNRIRFAFWGAEESGLLGSEHYVTTLPETELANIALNLNFDMVGSDNFVRFVYDGDGSATGTAGPPGSDQIEQQFLDYFASQGLPVEATPFDGRSDYGPFIDVGIPAGGLFTGAEGIKTPEQVAIYGGTAGEQYDPCYHQACDVLAGVNRTALDQMSDATATATWEWAFGTPPARTTATASAATAAMSTASGRGHTLAS